LLAVYLLARVDRSLLKTKLLCFFYYISCGWQLVVLGVLCFCPWVYRRGSRLYVLVLADIVVSVFAMMPLAGLTITSPRTYDRSAAAFYREDAGAFLLIPGAGAERGDRRDRHTEVNAMKVTGRRNFPSHTLSQVYFDYVWGPRYPAVASRPFVFATDSTRLRVSAIDLGYNYISVDVEAADSCQMLIRQTYYDRWRVRDGAYRLYQAEGGFMGVSLRPGVNRVRLYYYSGDLVVEGVISVVVLVVIGIVLVVGERKRRMPVKKAV
jgi:hypothetical protein